ncbi:unnamed protein product [Linum tenue]|uniref:Uncharacterized protein n=1 Tax=Linum tenue TaxID=586396 RepID=A0AAV0J9Z3_9ROSI|nr:unnamed protein product [Linum tenue]
MTEKETRYSVGLSSVINGVVHIPTELGYHSSNDDDGAVEEEEESGKPFRYRAFDHFGLLQFIRSGEAKNYDSAIQDYCGVV